MNTPTKILQSRRFENVPRQTMAAGAAAWQAEAARLHAIAGRWLLDRDTVAEYPRTELLTSTFSSTAVAPPAPPKFSQREDEHAVL